VYEPFCGSGTTIIGAETIGRSCLGIEIDPRYAHVAVQRWQQFTGKTAGLNATGASFTETAKERGKAEFSTMEAQAQTIVGVCLLKIPLSTKSWKFIGQARHPCS
jgi:DNA modification methylase